MKCLFVALTLAMLTIATSASIADQQHLVFNAWMKKHGKSYDTVDEFNHRFQVFQDNLKFVVQHNQEASKGLHTYTLGLNNLADLTNAEYRAMLLGYRRDNSTVHPATYAPKPGSTLPSTVDWRTKGVVTPVKDQGQCGSCWSFSATGAMEGAYALKTGKLVSMSEQNLIDCVNFGQYTCTTGGVMQQAFLYVAVTHGIDGEASYPYCTCSGNRCRFSAANVVGSVSSYKQLAQGSEYSLQAAAAEQPVSVAIDASSQQFQLYHSGVFNYGGCSSTQLDHGVLVVGYGTLNGADYWLVKNSWSTGWGDQGYIYMSRNRNNQCGIATDASVPIA